MDEKILEYGFDEQELEELLVLVSELAERYTGYESTSVSYERAQMLMEAVLYCIKECGESAGVAYAGMTLRAQYEAGLALLREKVEKIRRLFNTLTDTFDDYGVKCLSDTVKKGIPEFLKRYDVTFAPQETLLTLDYPLLIDLKGMCGADAVYEFLRAVETEQRFLRGLGRGYVTSVLERYDPCYEDMVENICSIVLADVIGYMAAKKPLTAEAGGFWEADRARILKLFGGKTVPETEELIKQMIRVVTAQYYGGDSGISDYLCREAGNLAARMGIWLR